MILTLVIIWMLFVLVMLVDARSLLKHSRVVCAILLVFFSLMDPTNFIVYAVVFGIAIYISNALYKTA